MYQPDPADPIESVGSLGRAYPGAVACVVDGLDELVAHLHYPRAHWPRIRHTNLISADLR